MRNIAVSDVLCFYYEKYFLSTHSAAPKTGCNERTVWITRVNWLRATFRKYLMFRDRFKISDPNDKKNSTHGVSRILRNFQWNISTKNLVQLYRAIPDDSLSSICLFVLLIQSPETPALKFINHLGIHHLFMHKIMSGFDIAFFF